MQHNQTLMIRVLTLAAILIFIVGALYLYEIDSIKTVKTKKAVSNPSPVASSSANPYDYKITGPGGCVGVDQCLQYCQDHPEVCAKPAQK